MAKNIKHIVSQRNIHRIKVYFYLKTEKSFVADSLWESENNSSNGIARPEGIKPTVSLVFDVPEKVKTGIKMGVSSVDAEQASGSC